MAKYGKWIAGGLGWAFLGPIGGIIGFALGSLLDATQVKSGYTGATSRNSFLISLLVLVSAVMKTDGRVLRSELEFAKGYFARQFGEAAAREAMILLRDILKQRVPLREVSHQIRDNMDYPSRLQLLHFLFGLANADRAMNPNETTVLWDIAGYLGIGPSDYESIKAMFIDNLEACYRVLELEGTATNEDVKRAYRSMALKHHPDKVSHLGEDIGRAAEKKFQQVNEAYEKIKKERGFV